jgi:hypothetical protein
MFQRPIATRGWWLPAPSVQGDAVRGEKHCVARGVGKTL